MPVSWVDKGADKVDKTGLIFNIMKYSISDGPGIRTTVFLKGCPLNCLWCHNPEGQSARKELVFNRDRCIQCGACLAHCPVAGAQGSCLLCGKCAELCCTGAREIIGQELTVSEVLAEIEKDIIFYDESGGGVTFSGGEPLLQAEFLLALLQACKEQGIRTAVDTTGFAPFSVLASAAQYTDFFLYDLKLMDNEEHLEYTGVPNQGILDNLVRLAECHQSIAIRVPIIPGLTDTVGNLEAMATFLEPIPIRQVEILPYHNTAAGKYQRLGRTYPLAPLASPASREMEEAAAVLAAGGHKVIIGGVSNE